MSWEGRFVTGQRSFFLSTSTSADVVSGVLFSAF